MNSEETEKQSEQGSDTPPTNGNRLYHYLDSAKKFAKKVQNVFGGNKNVDKSKKNTDKEENQNSKNNETIEEDPFFLRVCGQSQQNTEKEDNENLNNNESIEDDPTAKNKLNKSNSNNSGNKDKMSEKNHPVDV